MTDDLYERYKEALRSGHVAALRGQLEDAVEAYKLAATLAPARAMPHSSLGGVYLRLNLLDEALAEFAAAVARAPQDEGALLGQSEALETVGRYGDAAVALDRVAQIQEAAGRMPEAADTLRRALELDDSPERVRRHRSLVRQIRLSAGDQAAEQALARALRLREAPVPAPEAVAEVPQRAAASPLTRRAGLAAAASAAAGALGAPAQAPEERVEPAVATFATAPGEPVGAAVDAESDPAEAGASSEEALSDEPFDVTLRLAAIAAPAPDGEDEAMATSLDEGANATESGRAAELDVAAVAIEPETEPEAIGAFARYRAGSDAARDAATEREPIGVIDVSSEPAAAIDLSVPSGDELTAAADEIDRIGDPEEARRLLVSAARAYSGEGRFEAALDTAHQVLRRHPADVDGHLVLVELYVSRRWDSLAAEKLLLLGRLAELDGDEETKGRLCAAASRAFPANGRLAALCS